MPRLTIITVNLNNACGLNKTINSVLQQTFRDYEFVIIDGGSNDGSVDIIREYADALAYWCSERDGGIYYGMNKGIDKAAGEYCLFLNSGDWLTNKYVLEEVFQNQNYTEQLLVGRRLTILPGGRRSRTARIRLSDIDKTYFYSNTLPHQCTFIKTAFIRELKGYCTDYRIVSDWIFWHQAVSLRGARIYPLNVVVAVMQEGGVSSNREKCHQEMADYLSKQNPQPSLEDWLNIIDLHRKASELSCAARSKAGRLLIRLAKFISKHCVNT